MLWDAETPHLLQIRLKDGGDVVSLTSWPLFTLRNISGNHFSQRLSLKQ
jgi:hypothetical protein